MGDYNELDIKTRIEGRINLDTEDLKDLTMSL